MGRLQDNHYKSPRKPRERKEVSSTPAPGKEKLLSIFCPPLDSALIEAIWSDVHDYERCFTMLKALAKEADVILDQEASTTSTPPINPETGQEIPPDADSLDFLKLCFPTMEMSDLQEALQQAGDVEGATDILLNNAFLENDTDSTTSNDSIHGNDVVDQGPSEPQRSRKKKKKVIWSSNPSFTPSPDDVDSLATVPFNYWHQYDKQVETIAKVFPSVPHTYIHGCVQQCRGHIIASVRAIMQKYPALDPVLALNDWASVSLLEQVQQKLGEIMVDRTATQVRQVAVGVIVHGLWQQQQQLEQQQSLESREETLESRVNSGVEFFLNYDAEQEALAKRLKQLALRGTPKKNQPTEQRVIPEYLLMDNRQSYSDDDPRECRDIAMDLIMERNNLYRKAAAAYRQAKNKGPGEGGVAFYYSDEARQLDQRARDWNMRAARALVRQHRLEKNDDHLLDLHGLTVAEAQVLIKEGVTQWWSRSQMQSSRRQRQPLKIITGIGKHSMYGESKLMPSALKLLKRDGWQVEVSDANPGCIFVKGLAK